MATLKIDVLVNGTTVCTTPGSYTTAGGSVPAVFSSTRIETGDLVNVQTTSDSGTVTDVGGTFIIRPLLGLSERMGVSDCDQRTADAAIDASFSPPPEYAQYVIPIGKIGSISTSTQLWGFAADKNYEIVSLNPYAATA